MEKLPPRHANGDTMFPKKKGLCRVCGRALTGRRRSFCGHECVDKYTQKVDAGYLRRKVEERDKGVCQLCKLDTTRLEKVLKFLTGWTHDKWRWDREHALRQAFWAKVEADYPDASEAQCNLLEAPFKAQRVAYQDWVRERHRHWLARALAKYPQFLTPSHRQDARYYVKHLWEMDHIIPVAEGGGSCGLENLRCLCVPCHRAVTKELRGRLAGNKKKT